MIRHLPNVITLVNLFSGCLAIIFLFQENNKNVMWCVAASLLADLLDGLVARMLHVTSKIGKELDSLADLTSFGVLPGFLVFHMLLPQGNLAYVALLIPIFSALRLAKFNIDERQTHYFLGLPTPASTIFILGLYLTYSNDAYGMRLFLSHPLFLLAIVILVCALLVSEIPLFSLKFSTLTWKENRIKIIFALLSLILCLFLSPIGFSMTIVLYVAISLFTKHSINNK